MTSVPNVLEVWDSNDDGGVTNQATFTATALASAPADSSLVIIVVHTVRSSTSDTPNSVTAGGKSFTHYQRVEIDTSPSFVSHLDIYYAAGTGWTTAAPVVNFTPTHFGVQIAVLEFTDALNTGTNGIDGLVQQANTRNSSLASSTPMGPTLSAFGSASNGTLFVFCTGLNDTTDPNTLDSPLTEIAEMGSTTQFRTTTVGFYTGNELTPSGFHTFGSNGEAGCIAIEIAAASGPLTVALSPAVLTLAAPAMTPAGTGNAALALAASALSLVAPALTPVVGGADVPLSPAALSLVAPAMTPSATGTAPVALEPASLSLVAPPLVPAGTGNTAVALAAVALTLVAPALSPAVGGASVALSPASLTLVAPALSPAGTGSASVALSPASLTLVAPPMVPVGSGNVAVALAAALLTMTAPALTPVVGGASVALAAASLSLVAPELVPSATGSAPVALSPATFTLVAPPMSPSGSGSVAVALAVAGLTLVAVALASVQRSSDVTPRVTVVAGARTLALSTGSRSLSMTAKDTN